MAITIQGIATLQPVDSRQVSVTRDDSGVSSTEITVRGRTAKTAAGVRLTLAQAREIERQLRELAANRAYARAIYLDSDEHGIDDGLYELTGLTTTVQPDTNKTFLVDVSLSARRLGGGSTVAGANVARRVYPAPTLQTNSWSITSTPIWALPIGASALDVVDSVARASADGSIPLVSSSSSTAYALAGADYNKGEVKIWDTTGDSVEANWQRVFSPDHTFATIGHCVVENGLIRFKSLHSGTNKACHTIEVRAGGAWVMVTDATAGDGTQFGAGGIVTDAYDQLLITEITPWRVVMQYRMLRSTSPSFWSKTITLDRGKWLALVELTTAGSAAYAELGMPGSGQRFVVTRPTVVTSPTAYSNGQLLEDDVSARDHTVQSGSATLDNGGDNWVATWTGTSATAMGIGAIRTTSTVIGKSASGGFALSIASTTALRVYLGGVPYDATKSWGEAETGQTLDGTATAVSTLAGASGSGNNQVLLDAVNDGVTFTGLARSTPAGNRLRLWMRVAASAIASANDNLRVAIYNVTTVTTDTLIDIKANHLTAANTWYWVSLEYGAWNGNDTMRPVATCTSRGDLTNWYVDQCLFLTIAGSSDLPDYVANEALTEVRVYHDISAVVRM